MKLVECCFCRNKGLYSKYFYVYVCDDCYEKNQVVKKDEIK